MKLFCCFKVYRMSDGKHAGNMGIFSIQEQHPPVRLTGHRWRDSRSSFRRWEFGGRRGRCGEVWEKWRRLAATKFGKTAAFLVTSS
ncbi:uncharacterized protein LOC143196663 isoform X4 [Rhynchophorus ferrugineus]|uniref:uncharacterized protein LOC143196663 isoform X4 n=1 Tax=Rhynchophorus ferrugineus TaxID=354439 RepID=UPI003FCD00BD